MKQFNSSDKIKNAIVNILRNYDIQKAAIFGSFARGESNKKSDVDLLILTNGKMTLFQLFQMQEDIEKAIARKVDIVEYDAIKPSIKDSILNEALPIL
jgi:hypothetical protein